MADRVKTILSILKKGYPSPSLVLEYKDPLELLIATILAAQCPDQRVNAVTSVLFKKYRTASDYAKADPSVFEGEIRTISFYKNKAKNIVACCKEIVGKYGNKVPDELYKLITLPGVGRKTANILLGNAFGKQAIAVDTHVQRVSRRLDLASSTNPDKIEDELSKLIPQREWTITTLRLGAHGRKICAAKRPLCPQCPLFNICESEDKVNACPREMGDRLTAS